VEILEEDFSTLRPGKSYSFAYAVDNTFFALPSRADQLRCMHSVAALLRGDGLFLLEANVPSPDQISAGALTRLNMPDQKVFECFVVQGEATRNIVIEVTETVRLWELTHCYIPTVELDEMAEASGLSLENRWNDWNQTPHNGNAWRHISIWRRAQS
jgi:hypothetical protein